jgi:diaminopimelate epimerase
VTIPFVKVCACGNDFLIMESAAIENSLTGSGLSEITQRICNRHDGVGADGVEWMYPHPTADLEVRLINADGSEAEISGNGTRCVAAYVCAEKKKEKVAIQTGAGLKICTLKSVSDSGYEFEAAMGEGIVEGELVLKIGGEFGGKEVRGVPVIMGNPHYVVFVTEFANDWREQSAAIQRNSHFKHGVNIEVVIADRKHDVSVRYFERGVGETQSSGTGSCASVLAAIATGRAESPVTVHTPGGTQIVRIEENQVFLRGWARLVCRGEFFLT